MIIYVSDSLAFWGPDIFQEFESFCDGNKPLKISYDDGKKEKKNDIKVEEETKQSINY